MQSHCRQDRGDRRGYCRDRWRKRQEAAPIKTTLPLDRSKVPPMRVVAWGIKREPLLIVIEPVLVKLPRAARKEPLVMEMFPLLVKLAEMEMNCPAVLRGDSAEVLNQISVLIEQISAGDTGLEGDIAAESKVARESIGIAGSIKADNAVARDLGRGFCPEGCVAQRAGGGVGISLQRNSGIAKREIACCRRKGWRILAA